MMNTWLILVSELGVCLGLDSDEFVVWSKKEMCGYDCAITFAGKNCIDRFITGLSFEATKALPKDMKFIEVKPDLPDSNLSKAACEKLGVWL